MKYRFLARLGSMLLVWLLLLGWQRLAGFVGLPAYLVVALLVAVPLAMSGVEVAFCRRHAFREQYLNRTGWLWTLTGFAPLLVVVELLKALTLALVLVGASTALDLRGWMMLLLLVLVLSFLMPRLPGLLHDSVNPLYVYPLARRWAIWFGTLFLWCEAMLILLLVEDNDYRGLDWTGVIAYSMDLPTGVAGDASGAALVNLLLHIDAGVAAAGAWARDYLLHGGGDLAATLVALMALGGVALLYLMIAWAFSQAFVGVTARPRGVWAPKARSDVGVYEPWWY